MVRSFRLGALVAVLACTAPGWGQSMQPDTFVTVREQGKPAVKCKVIKCWKEKDGSRVCQVQSTTSGEMMTIVDAAASPGQPAPGSRVFSWGKSKTSPAGVPAPPAETTVVRTRTEPARPGLISKLFGSSSSSTTVVKAGPAPADLRESWGKVETATAPAEAPKLVQTSGRPELPLARKASGDPLERPDIYTSAPAGIPAVKTDSGVTTATLPLAPPAPATVKTEEKPSVTSTTVGSCGSCAPCDSDKPAARRPFPLRDFGSSGRSGLFASKSGSTSSCGSCTTVVQAEVKQDKPAVVSEPREGLFRSRLKLTKSEPEAKVIKVEEVKKEPAKLQAATAGQEPHVGVFAGLFNPSPAAPSKEAAPARSNLPAGLTSISAAARASAGSAAATPVGAIVRTPDGQHRVVDLSQGGGVPMVSVPMTGSNAFTRTAQAPPTGYYPTHQTLANAFTLPTPSRPLPADEMMRNYVTNGLDAEGMGGAERRPPMAMAYYHPMTTGYYYPVPAVTHGGMTGGVAVASDLNPSTAAHLAALRQSLMPSERERAVAGLVQAGWRSDPQVVPALVMAAQTDPAPAVRVTCVRALGQMKATSLPAVQAVTALTKDHDARVRHEAERVLPMLTK